jgi:hypothetical protein
MPSRCVLTVVGLAAAVFLSLSLSLSLSESLRLLLSDVAWIVQVLRSRGQGAGILVSRFPKETSASFSLREPAEVKDFLRMLVAAT